MELIFKPILKEDYNIAYANLIDSFEISFGTDRSLWPGELGRMTEQKYAEILAKKQSKNSESAIHVWQNGKIIGQIEMSLKTDESNCSYINLYYLIPEKRGLGLGKFLDQFASDWLMAQGCSSMELTVEPSNENAISFYKKQGWVMSGMHPVYGGLLVKKNIGKF